MILHPEVYGALAERHVAEMRARARFAGLSRRGSRRHSDSPRQGPMRALSHAVSHRRPPARHRRPNRTPRERHPS